MGEIAVKHHKMYEVWAEKRHVRSFIDELKRKDLISQEREPRSLSDILKDQMRGRI